MKTEGTWEGISVDLSELAKCVENFFRGKGLTVKRIYSEESIKICIVKEGENFCVEITGNSQKFKVSVAYGDRLQRFKILGPAFSPFLGGGVMLKSLKAQEFFEKLERELWDYLSRVVNHLNRTRLR